MVVRARKRPYSEPRGQARRFRSRKSGRTTARRQAGYGRIRIGGRMPGKRSQRAGAGRNGRSQLRKGKPRQAAQIAMRAMRAAFVIAALAARDGRAVDSANTTEFAGARLPGQHRRRRRQCRKYGKQAQDDRKPCPQGRPLR